MTALDRMLRRLAQTVRLVVARAVVQLVDDTKLLQALQVSMLGDETRQGVERFQEYGFTSHPLPGAEAVAVAVMGSRDHLVVVAVDDRRYRLRSLQAGEVALYDDTGTTIVLKRGGVVEVTAATRVDLLAPTVHCSGTLQVDGDAVVTGNVTAGGNVADQGGSKTMAGMRAAYNAHKHGTSPTPDQVQ